MNLRKIRGIALIDEIDAHLDAHLQRDVHPELISLLPNVQFIATSHAPLFLLGMEAKFRSDGFQCREMPGSIVVTAERFSEFERSYQYFHDTVRFERHLRELYMSMNRPLVLTEGATDARHLRHALYVLGYTELLDDIEIREVGQTHAGGTRGGGKSGLDAAWNVLTRFGSQGDRAIILLYDHDAAKPDTCADNVYVRSLTKNDNNSRIGRGIENLYPEELFVDSFYTERAKTDGYGATTTIRNFDKNNFCDWICANCTDAVMLEAFEPVIQTLNEVLSDLA